VAVVWPDQIYMVADTGLLLFNGTKVGTIETPEGDMSGLVVRDNGDLLCTCGEGLWHWSEVDQAWEIMPRSLGP
jgi:hypothetical protein